MIQGYLNSNVSFLKINFAPFLLNIIQVKVNDASLRNEAELVFEAGNNDNVTDKTNIFTYFHASKQFP
jgi:hypothetical protein